MAEDPNEDSWLYGGPPNANDDDAAQQGIADANEEGIAKVDDATAEEDKLNDVIQAPKDALHGSEEDDVFKEDGHFARNADRPDDDAFEDEEAGANEGDVSETNAARRVAPVDGDRADAAKDDGDEDNEWPDSDDNDDDDINVVIGDIKSGSTYNIKQRPPLLGPGGTTVLPDKSKQAPGKFSIDEFECVGTISGVPAHEFSIDSLDEKPWRKPGADITDYFNYGFNEDTWRAYCERQKQMRLNESGVGLQGLSAGLPPSHRMMDPRGDRMAMGGGGGDRGDRGGPDRRDDMGYRGGDGHGMSGGFMRRSGPPMGRKPISQIDVIGSVGGNMQGGFKREPDMMMQGAPIPTKENVIQVMTAERREYSRIQSSFVPNEPFYEPEPNYNYGYEPTQEQQWNSDQPAWTPTDIKELTSGPQMVPPPHQHGSRAGAPGPLGAGGGRDRGGDRADRLERGGASDRERDRDRTERGSRTEYPERSRDRVKSEDRRERDRADRGERSTRREATTRDRSERTERSRSRDRRRRSKSRDKDRKSRDRKKSHKKDKEIKEERLSD